MKFDVKSWLSGLFLTFCLYSPAVAAISPIQHFRPSNGAYIATIPQGWTVHTDYSFNGLEPGHPLPGVLFSIPQSETAGTNLSPLGTGVAVVSLPAHQPCRARDYLASARVPIELNEAGALWSVAHSTDVGAGTKSTTQIFARHLGGTCVLVLYLVRTRALAIFPPGSVHRYDRFALLGAFDQIRHSLVATSSANIKPMVRKALAATHTPVHGH